MNRDDITRKIMDVNSDIDEAEEKILQLKRDIIRMKKLRKHLEYERSMIDKAERNPDNI